MLKGAYTKWTTWFFFVMAVFAILFAKERFQADGAHYLLHVANSENFRIEHQRFILAFSQFLPWIGVKLGGSLNLIFILNSLNAVLWFYILFLYATYYLKDRRAGIAIVLTHVLGVLHIQFTPMYEIWYGIPLVILLYSHLSQGKVSHLRDLIFFGAVLVTALFAHPLLFIPIAFALIYSALEKRKLEIKILIISVLLFAGWYVAKKLMLTEYEAGKLGLATADWNESYRQLLRPAYYWELIQFFFTWYTIPILILVWTSLFFLVRKMKVQLLVSLLFFIGHILVVNFTHTNDPILTPYFERMYLPLIPIVLIPLVFTLCREMQLSQSFIVVSLLLIIGWRIGRFTDVGMDYKARTEQVEQLINVAHKKSGSKFVMNEADYKSCFKWADWSFPMETLLRSGSMHRNSGIQVSIATPDDMNENDNRNRLRADEFVLRRWEIMKDSEINSQYFRISRGRYIELPAICQ